MLRLHRLAAVLTLSALASPAASAAADHWVASWAAAPVEAVAESTEASPVTLREIVHLSLGGAQARITLSNRFGSAPITIDAATLAPSLGLGSIPAASACAITFAGKPSVVIAAGASVDSDPIDMPLPSLSNVAISLFLPAQSIPKYTQHTGSHQTNYIARGNQTTASTMSDAKTIMPWRFLTALDVMAPTGDSAIVALGDSITDGTGSTTDSNTRWPNLLAARLDGDPKTARFGVVDEGIGGNRILHDGIGPSAVSRFDTDVLEQAGVKYVIILEGINDITRSSLGKLPENADKPRFDHIVITADQLIAAYSDFIAQAHAKGIKVIGATLTPFQGSGGDRPDGQQIRETLNNFIRTSGKFDGVIDFAKAVADPSRPLAYLPADDHGDHLHPNDAGYKAMADSIPLGLFH